MVRIDDLLAPWRRQLSRYSLIESLCVVCAYMQHLQFGTKIPDAIEINAEVASETGYDRNYHEWELDLLAQGLLQYAPMRGSFSLTRWGEFATTLNLVKQLDNDISLRAGELMRENVLLELGRIAYRQFPWQEHPNHWRLTRYYKIFGDPVVDAIISVEVGLTAKELYLLGLAFTGHFIAKFDYPYPVDFNAFGISDEKRRIFMRRFSKPLSELSKLATAAELRNEDFNYSTNPLRIFPLAHASIESRHSLIAPIPTFLFHRFTAGIYYELTDNPHFGSALGDSFQRYVGEVLQTALPAESFTLLSETEYHAGRNRKDTIDWIATDGGAHLFVECKTKRMKLSAQIALADTAPLESDIAKIADFAVQTYKAIHDARSGQYPHWRPDNRPIFPMIVLLEEWFLFDFKLEQALDRQIHEKLSLSGLDPAIVTECPYSICSIGDFEVLAQVIATTGIIEVFRKKHDGEKTKWNMKSFLMNEFGEQVSQIPKGGLFPEVLNSIHPAISDVRPT